MPSTRSLLSRFTRLALLLSTIAIVFGVSQASALAAGHSAHNAKPHAATSGPPEGMFDNCDLNSQLTTCEQRLSVMSQAGLKVVVLAVGYSTEPNMQAYAAYAQSLGMSVMWELNDPGFWGGPWAGSSAANDFSQFAAACGCTDTSGVLQSMISFLASLPGTYGYYAADDETLTPGQKSGLASYVSEIKTLDPNHMVMVGDSASQGQSYVSSGAVMGNEIYPVINHNIQNVNNNLAAWDSVQQQVTQGQASASRNGQGSAFILQAFTFGDNLSDGEAVDVCTASMSPQQCYGKLLYPNQQVQEELRNEVLEHSHAKLILWYSFQQTFGQAGTDTYSIYPTGALATSRWTAFTSAINSPLPSPLATAANAHRKDSKTHSKASSHKRRTRGHRHTVAKHRHTKARHHR